MIPSLGTPPSGSAAVDTRPFEGWWHWSLLDRLEAAALWAGPSARFAPHYDAAVWAPWFGAAEVVTVGHAALP